MQRQRPVALRPLNGVKPAGSLDSELVSPSTGKGPPAWLPQGITILSITILVLVGCVLAFTHPRFHLTVLAGDDAGYYLAVARNYALGFGYSFDRINPTNGFNPLMPILLIGLFRVFSHNLDLVTGFRIATLITWLALVAGVVPFRRLTRRVLEVYKFPMPWVGTAVAGVTFFYAAFLALKGYYGMDAFLVLGLALIWLGRVSSRGLLSPGVFNAVIDGGLIGAIILARVDSMSLAIVAFGIMLLRVMGGRGTLAQLGGRFLVFAVLVIPYFVWNALNFGDWLPISARLKTAFPHLDIASSLNTVLHTSVNPADLVVLFVGFVAAVGWCIALAPQIRAGGTPDSSSHVRDAMLVLSAYMALRLTWLLAFSRFDVQSSYFILAAPFVAVSVLVVMGRWRPPAGAISGCVGLLAVALVLIAGKVAVAFPQIRAVASGAGDNGWNLAQRIHSAVRQEEVIFGGAQGLVGYFADRSWINGDGVANNRQYEEAKAQGRVDAYLRCYRVNYVVIDIGMGSSLPNEHFGSGFVLKGDQIGRDQTVWLLSMPNRDLSPASVAEACQSLRGAK